MKATFFETDGFSECREDFLSDSAYRRLQNDLMAEPDLGDVMPGCGGLRKLRTADPSRGKGKRGGARIIYMHVPDAKCFYLIDVYGKGEKDDLSASEKSEFGTLARAIKKYATTRYQTWLRENDRDQAT